MRKNLFNQHIPSLPNILTSFKLAASQQGLFFIQSKNIYIYFQWYLEHKYPLQYFYLRTIHSNWNVHTYKTTLLYMYTQRLLPPFEVAVVCVCVKWWAYTCKLKISTGLGGTDVSGPFTSFTLETQTSIPPTSCPSPPPTYQPPRHRHTGQPQEKQDLKCCDKNSCLLINQLG